MVKHIILWKLKNENNNDNIKSDIKRQLEALNGKIAGLIKLEIQTCSLPSSNADVMLYSEFENEAALKGYAIHPDHVFVADNYVRPFVETRLCLDFEQ